MSGLVEETRREIVSRYFDETTTLFVVHDWNLPLRNDVTRNCHNMGIPSVMNDCLAIAIHTPIAVPSLGHSQTPFRKWLVNLLVAW